MTGNHPRIMDRAAEVIAAAAELVDSDAVKTRDASLTEYVCVPRAHYDRLHDAVREFDAPIGDRKS